MKTLAIIVCLVVMVSILIYFVKKAREMDKFIKETINGNYDFKGCENCKNTFTYWCKDCHFEDNFQPRTND